MTDSQSKDLRPDLQLIANLIAPESRVLEVGCANGDLLQWLVHNKRVDGRGMELGQAGVNTCVSKGLYVVQGDADVDLKDYPDKSFDYAVLSRTLQAVRQPREVLLELLRIGEKAIVTIPNFGHWKIRLQLLMNGKMPVTRHLDYTWYNTPNIHFCTVKDMLDLIESEGLTLDAFVPFDAKGDQLDQSLSRANWGAHQALFVISD
ncbi:methionine biosynthesis protein MetW [Temperatibacter marinus]|uniref:Methionine biosynthesis protein MetW n=1 Tax=Temperatibacter marinus TaxID=1456591 RepID=A0AA52EEI8_9PROT|nr:methionine biosynthesis protein MetW [Temperatibacter marinus]WND04022.1 methionine biosynthesis protein MetW [Temperatibacter marinus]